MVLNAENDNHFVGNSIIGWSDLVGARTEDHKAIVFLIY